MKIFGLLSFILLFYSNAYNQGRIDNFELVAKIDRTCEYMTTDQLGNIYIGDAQNLYMYNKFGDSLNAFNSRRFGDISFVDATDPYKILVYFQDYNFILFLDNYLAENGEAIDLQTLGFDQSSMACRSRENGFWVFDRIRQKIFHLDADFNQTHETVNLIQWFGKRINPNFMVEYNNQLYVNEKKSGIYVFDHFGTFLKKIPIQDLDHFQVREASLNFEVNDQLCSYSMVDFEQNCTPLNNDSLVNARVEKEKLYLSTRTNSFIYRIK